MANLEVFKHTYTTTTPTSHARAGGKPSLFTQLYSAKDQLCVTQVISNTLITLLCTSLHWEIGEKTHAPSEHPAPPAPIPEGKV